MGSLLFPITFLPLNATLVFHCVKSGLGKERASSGEGAPFAYHNPGGVNVLAVEPPAC
jgi:hypothetical protein